LQTLIVVFIIDTVLFFWSTLQTSADPGEVSGTRVS